MADAARRIRADRWNMALILTQRWLLANKIRRGEAMGTGGLGWLLRQESPRVRDTTSRRGVRGPMRVKSVPLFFRNVLLLAGCFAVILVTTTRAPAQAVAARPCDLYAAKTPCVAAFSTTRSLYSETKGP